MRSITRPTPSPVSIAIPLAAESAGCAHAFCGGPSPTVALQARVRQRETRGRGSLVASGIPRPRATQVLDAVLRLPVLRDSRVTASDFDVYLHRPDDGRWQHHYALALAAAMVSSLAGAAVPSDAILIGDLDLQGGVRDVPPAVTDALNDALDAYRIETPVTLLLAPDSAAWVRRRDDVRVIACRSLEDAIAAAWPRSRLELR